MGLLKMVTKKTKHVKAYTNKNKNKYNLITLGGVNEVVLIVFLNCLLAAYDLQGQCQKYSAMFVTAYTSSLL
jgi:hypothetical protein